MQRGDIIEIVQNTDGLHIRRIKVDSLRLTEDGMYAIIGVNLQGKNPIHYTLPKQPIKSPQDVEDGQIGWIPCAPVRVIDE